jgi:branched-chain amino acid transport system ATP-binding protein
MLEVNGVSVNYDKAIIALEDVEFTVAKGDIVALLGPNGAGKTTLMKAIAGMLPFEQGEIINGQITFDGNRLNRRNPAAVTRLGVALVQDGRQCFRNLSVAENLRAASFVHRTGATERLDMVFKYFPVLKEMMQRQAGHLSGGQLQMLVIGMALMGNPKLLMLDEPSLGLSPVMVASVFKVVEQMHKDLGMTVLVAEQTVPRLLQIATDVYVLSRGRIVMHTTPAEADQEALQRLYLSWGITYAA